MNLEQFPTSETAKKMLGYITGNGFYDNSYVGKWIFQVMGEEMGDARAIIDELPLQAFVETATWGLRYHEEKYGLPIRENLSPDERRKIILEKRDLKAPMSPWRMEKIISGILGCTVDVVDINEPGSKISHPNMFIVYLEGEGEFSLGKAVEKLDEVKQSHTFYELRVRIAKFILDEKFFWKNIIRTNFTWWDACLDGRELLDGSILLDARHPPFFIPYFSIIAKNTEIFRSDVVRNRLIGIGEYGNISAKAFYRASVSWWDLCLDGKYLLDGSCIMNAVRSPFFGVAYRNSISHEESFSYGKAIHTVSPIINQNTGHFRDVQRAKFLWTDYTITLDGEKTLDGSICLNQDSPPEISGIRNRAVIEHEEIFNVTMYNPADSMFLDGACMMDGTKKLNSGREEL